MTTTTTDFLLDLFEQVRQANARNAEKDRMIASFTDKLDAVLENYRKQRLDLESWLAWNASGTRSAKAC